MIEGDGPPATWRGRDVLAMAVVTIAGLSIRLWGVRLPVRPVFDESFYAHDACVFVTPVAVCGGGGEAFSQEHPLLGKWLIAAGVKVFGYGSFGWRIVPVLVGTAGIALTYLLAWRLMRSTAAATLAAGLLAVDGMHFVLSRTAMLDVFVTTFSLATILFVSIDRDRDRVIDRDRDRVIDRDRDPRIHRDRERLRDRPWLLAAGLAGGAAVSTKWSGIPFLLVAAVLVLLWERRAARELDATHRRAAGGATLAPVAVFLVAVPLAVYVASFAGRLDGRVLAAPWDHGSWVWAFLRRQGHMLAFHVDLRAASTLRSPAWSWPLLKRPVPFAFQVESGRYREILALGNPVVWWGGTLAASICAVRWLRNLAGSRAEGVILSGIAAGYLWWIPVTSSRSLSFDFYFLPAVPFLCIAIARALQPAWRTTPGRVATAAVAGAAVAAFAFFLPILADRPITPEAWRSRMWFTACPPGTLEGVPPPTPDPGSGWCWA
jgi:dolichyl-phosphate-mannose-protein mannosyltransferase